MEYHSAKHKELSEQLTSWWRTQTEFKTKKALAGLLKVHPDTLGDYLSGRQFPKSDIANRLYEITDIKCLKPDVGGNSFTEMVSQESPAAPLFPDTHDVAASTGGHQEPVKARPIGHNQEESRHEKNPEVITEQPPGGLPPQGERYGEKSVIISLQRTKCPFCAHDIARFRSCAYCGQHFVWANTPVENSEPL